MHTYNRNNDVFFHILKLNSNLLEDLKGSNSSTVINFWDIFYVFYGLLATDMQSK